MVRARGRIVVVSAAVEAGHDGSTDELARRLQRRGFEVERHDFITLLPARLGGGSLRLYHAVLNRAPWVYGALFALGNRRASASQLVGPLRTDGR